MYTGSNVIGEFKKFFLTDTGRDVSIVFVGTSVNIIAGGLFFVIVPRILGPANYGLFSTVIATGLMAAAIANFGIDTGILKFAQSKSQLFDSIMSIALRTYLFLGFTVSGFGLFFSTFLAKFLGHPEIGNLLRIAFAGMILLLFTNFFVAGLQAKQDFLKASIVTLSSNIFRLILIILIFYFFQAGIYLVTILYFIVLLISILVGGVFLRFNLIATDKKITRKFLIYNFWIAFSLIIFSVPFDNYFLLKLAGPIYTGIYAAPFKILTFVYQFGGNFTRVLASRFSSFDTDRKVINFSAKSLVPVLTFSFILVLFIIFAQAAVNLIFGKEYLESVNVLRILSLGFIFFFISTVPSSIILYYFGKSNVSLVITLLKYAIFVSLLFLLIPSHKATGAAIAFSLGELSSLLLMTIYVISKLSFKNEH